MSLLLLKIQTLNVLNIYVLLVNTQDQGLAGGGQQFPALGKHRHRAVGKAAMDGLNMDVAQDPLGRHELAIADGIVETVAPCRAAQRAADAAA